MLKGGLKCRQCLYSFFSFVLEISNNSVRDVFIENLIQKNACNWTMKCCSGRYKNVHRVVCTLLNASGTSPSVTDHFSPLLVIR